MRIAFFALSVVACSSATTTQAAAPHVAAPVTTPTSSVIPTVATVAPQETSPAPQVTVPPPPKVVLHLGDSMVGGPNGLSRALEAKFKELGSTKFVRDWQEGVSILTFDHEHRLQDLIAKTSPDLIILTLGANDTTVPYPESLASSIRSLATKMSAGGRACYWMAPPTIFKKTTGIVSVIKKNAAPCKVFDPTFMKIARAGDGIHPTNGGGTTWADAFFAYFNGTGPATPNDPVTSDAVAAK